MLLERPQDRPAAHVKHLNRPIITSRHDQLPIFSKLGSSCCPLEPRYRLDHFPRFGCVNQDSSRGRDGIAVWARRAKVNMSNGRWMTDEQWMAEGVEMA